jgi:predicted peptidase
MALMAIAMLAGMARAGDLDSMLKKRIYKDENGKTLPYRLMKPDHYDPKMKYPLVLFLHGAGERGTDNEKQLVHGVPEFAKAENRKKYPCFLIAPQCPAKEGWSDFMSKKAVASKGPSEPGRLAVELVKAIQKEFSIDPDRLYITGLSMGGFGTWDIICRNPDMFAAAVPICGGGDESQAEKIAKMPIWVFHGAKDPIVKPERSREMVDALKKAGGNPKYTEYPGVAHNSWEKAYKDHEMFKWLFEQKKR